MERTVSEQYEGVWKRAIIVRSTGGYDTSTSVWWFQGPRFAIDLRIPADGAQNKKTAFAGVTNLSASELGEICTWNYELAFPQIDESVDSGYTRFLDANHLHEKGIDGTYEEYWYRLQNGSMVSSRLVSDDGKIHYSIEGERYKAVAVGSPNSRYEGNEYNPSAWTSVSVFEKNEESGKWDRIGTTDPW